jgi:hypothetical protein
MTPRLSVIALALAVSSPAAIAAQSPPPVNGTIATEATMKAFYKAAHTIVVVTVDGIERVYQLARDIVVHGEKHDEALAALEPGVTVVIHYTGQGADRTATEIDRIADDGLRISEGVVTRIDRGRRQITVRFDNGSIEVFEMTERAAAEATADPGALADNAKVVIYFAEENGRKVAHYFKKLR